MATNEFENRLIKRFNTLISLMLEIASKDNSATTASKIIRLHNLGLSPAEIGQILGKPTNYVTAVMNTKKRVTKKKG